MTISIRKIKLKGFRAYLVEQLFEFSAGPPAKSLAIFAPNAKGKSSLVDSIEFFFSADGTIKRLGSRAAGNQAGPSALVHVDAAANKIDPSVAIGFSTPSGAIEDSRAVGSTPIPEAAKKVRQATKVDFIVRGYELRRFVEDQTPEERYRETSSWFGLSRLPELQQELRSLRLELKKAVEDPRERDGKNKELLALTDNTIQSWSEGAVLPWLNRQILAGIDATLVLAGFEEADPSYQELRRRAAAEALDPILDAATQALSIVNGLFSRADHNAKGSLVDLALQATIVSDKRRAVEEERAKVANAAFQKLWEESEKLLGRKDLEIQLCPLCETDFSHSPLKSKEGVSRKLVTLLGDLQHYKDAQQGLESAIDTLSRGIQSLTSEMDALKRALEAMGSQAEASRLAEHKRTLLAWNKTGSLPEEHALQELLRSIAAAASLHTEKKATPLGQPYSKALAKVEGIRRLKIEIEAIDRYKVELKQDLDLIEKCEKVVIEDVRRHTQKVIDGLRNELEVIYRELNAGTNMPPAVGLSIREDTKKPYLELTIDFSPSAKRVAPSGYLSDSQLHTLALSLRLSAIKLLNQAAPFIVLDDIVTSYDVDHRRALASTLAKHFGSFQIIAVTHDQVFHRYLKDVMPAANWDFQVITEIRKNHGPKLLNHRVPEKLIEDRIADNQDIANDMRQFEEEWLFDICVQFGVDLRIREPARPFEYDRSELATSLSRFLKEIKCIPPLVEGVKNPFLTSLSTGTIENLGSHFQVDPSIVLSPADQRIRWNEFKEFRALFACPKCKKTRFSRPKVGVRHPLCKACDSPFEFGKAPEAPAAAK